MKVSDIDSVIHLLQSVSGWGKAFLILIILPIYAAGWSAVFKMLKINTGQSLVMIWIIVVSIIVSLVLLNIGVSKDKKIITKATQVKNIFLNLNCNWMAFSYLKDYQVIDSAYSDSIFVDELIER